MGSRPNRDTPFDLEILDSTRVSHADTAVSWSVPATAPNVLELLTTLDAVAQRSAVAPAPQSFDSTGSYLPEQLDRSPEMTGRPLLQYPPAALRRRREGRVWLEFIVDTTGAVETETIRVLMSDGDEFTEATLALLAKIRYSPGVHRGVPVRTLVRVPFTFSIAHRRLTIRIP
jgi:TonB family protein